MSRDELSGWRKNAHQRPTVERNEYYHNEWDFSPCKIPYKINNMYMSMFKQEICFSRLEQNDKFLSTTQSLFFYNIFGVKRVQALPFFLSFSPYQWVAIVCEKPMCEFAEIFGDSKHHKNIQHGRKVFIMKYLCLYVIKSKFRYYFHLAWAIWRGFGDVATGFSVNNLKCVRRASVQRIA